MLLESLQMCSLQMVRALQFSHYHLRFYRNNRHIIGSMDFESSLLSFLDSLSFAVQTSSVASSFIFSRFVGGIAFSFGTVEMTGINVLRNACTEDFRSTFPIMKNRGMYRSNVGDASAVLENKSMKIVQKGYSKY